MKYFNLPTITSAYKANASTTKNKFWGLLAILSSIDTTVRHGVNYDFSTSRVSELLERLFYIGDDKKAYTNDSTLYIMLSKLWTDKVSEQMFNQTPSIYDVLVWYFRTKSFEDTLNDSDLIRMFLESVHISVEDANKIFNFNHKDLQFSDTLYRESELSNALGVGAKSITAESSSIVARPGELSRAPFMQTLYANQSAMECLIITPFKFSDLYSGIVTNSTMASDVKTTQTIYYGCPGTGKSHEIKKTAEGENGEKIIWYDKAHNKVEHPTDEQKKDLYNNIFRTTFHPDYDYSTFVGCYKPGKDDSGNLDYRYVPQVFTNAYVAAIRHPDEPIYLIIEEINRGNCAQIFGDLFQLLDRTDGKSDYEIKPDTELAKYLASEGIPSESLKLPTNLHIYATMNTSDQSLFPMDSAFKRRWAMEYTPIKYSGTKADSFTFEVAGKKYSWITFLQMVNDMIINATDSEDKQMGEFFIKDSVTEKEFVNKVMFYLWNDVCKDLYNPRRVSAPFFMRVRTLTEGEKNDYFTFAELFSERNKDSRLLIGFLEYIQSQYKEKHPESTLTITD